MEGDWPFWLIVIAIGVVVVMGVAGVALELGIFDDPAQPSVPPSATVTMP